MDVAKTVSRHALVKGEVQGVFFRQSTQQQAKALGLLGWVRNLADGRVEVFWQGSPQEVAALQQWLQHGPEAARVEQLSCRSCVQQAVTDFKVLPSADQPLGL